MSSGEINFLLHFGSETNEMASSSESESEYTSSDSESDIDISLEGEYYCNDVNVAIENFDTEVNSLSSTRTDCNLSELIFEEDVLPDVNVTMEKSNIEVNSLSSTLTADSDLSELIFQEDATLFSPNIQEVVDTIYYEFSDENIQNCVKQCLDDLVNVIHNGVPSNSQKLARKRRRRISEWVTEKRKKACQSGKSFLNNKGKVRPAKSVKNKKSCENCRLKCALKVDNEQRQSLFDGFYSLGKDAKKLYIFNSTTCHNVARLTKKNGEEKMASKRQNTYSYFLNLEEGLSVKVCKSYFLGTFDISQKFIYNIYKSIDPETGLPKADQRGKWSGEKRKVAEEQRNKVLEHIKSFPTVDAHYCRAKTNKKYLEAGLNIQKMYALYKEGVETENKEPVKDSYYRRIFNTEFNIDFHVPKTDRCDFCEEFNVKKKEGIPISASEEESYVKHQSEKVAMRYEKERDKKMSKETLLLSYDLQNVITLPKADVGTFFYKRKLNLYNLTAKTSTKLGYCAIWSEVTSGRAGNDIASSFISILKKVISEHPSIEHIVCWSDSCVPQNRNSYISHAVIYFLIEHPNIKTITLKYSLPGHSGVQEVDNMHKQIDDLMRVTEFY